jgi:FixJ family two-component response regulator
VTDDLMPGVSGRQLIETVRNSGAPVGVIVLGASSANLGVVRERPGFTLLRKPFESASLQSTVRQARAGAFAHDDSR